MVGGHHRCNGHEFEQTLGVGDEQGGLACCGSWGHKESDTTERLNRTEDVIKPGRFLGPAFFPLLFEDCTLPAMDSR